MTPAQALELAVLAAIWGASFLFMRMGADSFGPVALAAVRATGSLLFLVPMLWWYRQGPGLLRHWRALLLLGTINSALPFLFYSYAALWIPAGLSSVFNAATPLFGAVIAWVWLGDRLNASRMVGLGIGFGGVAWLVASRGGFEMAPGLASAAAIAACMGATICYGVAASATRRYLSGVPPLGVAAGCQIVASMLLLPPAWFAWPAVNPPASAWVAALLLAVVCTGIAFVMYFRLIASAGSANALSVTFLVPLFAMAWGGVVLDEHVTLAMALGCGAILVGTGLTTGLVSLPLRASSPTQRPP